MNKLKPYFLVLLLAVLSISTAAQEVGNKLWEMQFDGKFFNLDNLGNVYLVGNDNSITKFNSKGKQEAIANFKLLGDIESIDLSNPMEIYVYYKDQQQLLLLDNQLSERGRVDLSVLSNIEIGALGRSYDNGIWVFDQSDARLLKYNKQLQSVVESNPIRSWSDEQWLPHRIYENGKKVFLLDSKNGLAIFDIFGQYSHQLDLPELGEVHLEKDKLLYYKDQELQSFDTRLLEHKVLLKTDAKDVQVSGHLLFIWKDGKIATFKT